MLLINPNAAFSWSGKTLSIETEGYGCIFDCSAWATTPKTAFHIHCTQSAQSGTQGSGTSIKGLHLKNFHRACTFDGGSGNGIRNCTVEVLVTSAGSPYTDPNYAGTGTIENNRVTEKLTEDGTNYSEKVRIVSRRVSGSKLVFNSPTSGFGIIPIGAVLPTLSNLPGAYNCTATTVADANGFVVCGGQVISDPTSPMNGATIPNVNDSYFIMGASATTGTLNAEQGNFTNPVYRIPQHGHKFRFDFSSGGGSGNTGPEGRP